MHLSGVVMGYLHVSHRGMKGLIHISLFLKLQVMVFDYLNVLEKD